MQPVQCECFVSSFPGVHEQPPSVCLKRECAVPSRSARWVVLMISAWSCFCTWLEKGKSEMERGGREKKKKKEKFQCWQQNISGSLTSCCSFNIGVCYLNLKKRKPFQNALSYLLSRKKSTSPPSPPPPKYNCDFSINFVWYCLSKEAIKYWLIPCSPTALSVSMKGSPEELLTGFEQSAMTAWRKKHCLAC